MQAIAIVAPRIQKNSWDETNSTDDDEKSEDEAEKTTFCGAFFEAFLDVSYGDIESLLNNLILMAALMLAFSVTFVLGAYGHNDFADGDNRYMQMVVVDALSDEPQLKDGGWLWTDGGYEDILLSTVYFWQGYLCCFYMFLTIITCYTVSFTLSVSSAGENDNFTKIWLLYNVPFVVAGILMFFIGMYNFFWMLQYGVMLFYPRYDMSFAEFWPETSGEKCPIQDFVSGVNSDACNTMHSMYNITSGQWVQGPFRDANRIGITGAHEDYYNTRMQVLIVVIMVLALLFGYVIASIHYAIHETCACCNREVGYDQIVEDDPLLKFLNSIEKLQNKNAVHENLTTAGLNDLPTLRKMSSSDLILLFQQIKISPGNQAQLVVALNKKEGEAKRTSFC